MRLNDMLKKIIGIACAVFGIIFIGLSGFMCFGLEAGGLTGQACVAVFTLVLACLSVMILRFERVSWRVLVLVLPMIGVTLLLRVINLDQLSVDYIYHLMKWYHFFKDNGGFFAISSVNSDYNVPYLYFMAFISYFDLPDLYMIKMLSLLFDIILAWGCLRLVWILRGRERSDHVPLVAFFITLLLPSVIINSSYWGQCDSVYTALAVHGIAMVLENRNKLSLMLMSLAFAFKLQTVFVLPVYGVLWLAGRIKFRELFVFPVTYIIAVLPAVLLGRPFLDTLLIYVRQAGEYPALTLNAPSVFQFLPYGIGSLTMGGTRYVILKIAGICAAALFVFFILYLGFRYKGRLDNMAIFAICAALSIVIPFLLPHMHERYFFMAGIFTLCAACLDSRKIIAAVLTEISLVVLYWTWLQDPREYFRIERPLAACFMLITCTVLTASVLFALREKDADLISDSDQLDLHGDV